MYAYSVRHVFVENIYIKAAPGTQVTYKSTDYVPYVRIYVFLDYGILQYLHHRNRNNSNNMNNMEVMAYLQLVIPDRTESMGSKLGWYQWTATVSAVCAVCGALVRVDGKVWIRDTRWHNQSLMSDEYNSVVSPCFNLICISPRNVQSACIMSI